MIFMQISISNYLLLITDTGNRDQVPCIMKIAQFLLFGGFWLVVLDPQKSNRAKNCCTCLQYGKAPSNIDLVPTPEIATIS